jgi:hypothetical protein
MTKPGIVVIGGLLIVIGVGLGMFARAKRWIKWPDIVPLQVTGDPPVTVGDGSLHAHSKVSGWGTEGDADKTIQAYPKGGKLYKDCGMTDDSGQAASVLFWHDDDKVDNISPDAGTGLTITITHDTDGTPQGGDPTITITIPTTQDSLVMTTNSGHFHKSDGKHYNRRHSRAGEVEKIVVVGGGNPKPWVPQYHNPHFTLSFCYH